ncbi:MAG: branched-chain amino acid ABC transporter permease [Leptotrichia sp.]|uniref:Branched-chain amino acid ABC transporter permease n=1 Tax=Leptotrichia rugosa TaxID=3239302 RepID=A0AB39VIE4_9FUSO|nr:branched-chain amino acid ABC transporter permease [Leptotrichia sp. oral taxon 498]ASQ47844.1 ABC transporter permease [Leptotrichia sp. oral taxon 498]RKW35504.1 MAG: branched-chain amino acid ABC transporter permease [Leptotrichia sp.]
MLKNLIEQTINGLQTGSIYALIALGYTMVYGIVKLINFAHGDILMIGAYLTFIAVSNGMPLIIAILLSIVFCAILGVVIDFFAYRPLRNAPKISALITAIGMSFLLESVALIIFGATPKVIDQKYIPGFLSDNKKLNLGVVQISMLTIFVIVVTIICMVALNLFIKKTKLGKATRAVSQDTGAAQLMGINVNKTIAITFAIGSGLGALGGALYAIVYPQIEPYMGMLPGLKAFIAAVFGGIGSIPGAMVGGYVLGLLEAYVKGSFLTTWANPIVFGILILILIFKPNGLFGKNMKEKV